MALLFRHRLACSHGDCLAGGSCGLVRFLSALGGQAPSYCLPGHVRWVCGLFHGTVYIVMLVGVYCGICLWVVYLLLSCKWAGLFNV